MIEVKFKNLERSELAVEAVHERLETLTQKFDDLMNCKIKVTLCMENSPLQAGPDLFAVQVYISTGRYEGLKVEKSDSNMYVALAQIVDHMLEMLNRSGDRARVKSIKQARKVFKQKTNNTIKGSEL